MKAKPTKGGIIRPGQKKPFRKCTKAEVERRLCIVENWIRQTPVKMRRISRLICEKFDLDFRTADQYISRARERMMKRLQRPREEFRVSSLAFYEGMLNDSGATRKEKLLAQKRIDELLGLCMPVTQKIEHSGEPTNKVQNSATIDELNLTLEERKKILKKLREKRQKEQPDNAQLLPFPLSAVG